MKKRIVELDYLKGILILLMVLFHLEYINNVYPVLNKLVYTFHMSGFLIISGFLTNINKSIVEFSKSVLQLLVPYLIFESLYVVMIFSFSSILSTSNKLSSLSFSDYLNIVFCNPIGTYWYLHTLVVCMVMYYLVYHIIRLKNFSASVVLIALLYLMTCLIGVSFSNTIYFLIGVIIFRCNNSFKSIIQPSLWSLIPLVVLSFSINNLNSGSLPGVIITILMLSVLLVLFDYLSNVVKKLFIYLGRNSLSIVVFSPVFTFPTRYFASYFAFDHTAILFGIFSLVFVIGGCLFSIRVIDAICLSRLIFYKKNCYVKF